MDHGIKYKKLSSDKREFWWKEVSFGETNNIQLLQWLCNSLKLFLVRLISLYIIVFNGSNVKVKFSCKGYQSTSSWANPMKRVTPWDQFKTHLKHQKNYFLYILFCSSLKGVKDVIAIWGLEPWVKIHLALLSQFSLLA